MRIVASKACSLANIFRVAKDGSTAPIPNATKHANRKPWVWADPLSNGIRSITDTGTGVLVDKVALNYGRVPGNGLGKWSRPEHRSVERLVGGSSVQDPGDPETHHCLVLGPTKCRSVAAVLVLDTTQTDPLSNWWRPSGGSRKPWRALRPRTPPAGATR